MVEKKMAERLADIVMPGVLTPPEPERWEISFPAYRLEEFENKVSKANRRLERAGSDARFTYTTKHYTTRKMVGGIELEDGTRMFGTEVEEPWVRATMDDVRITLGDYTFCAALVREEAGYTVHCAPGQDISTWRRPPADDMRCEHCGTKRIRNRLYVVRDNNTMQLIQLGHNCIELFTGMTPKGLNALTFDDELTAFASEDTGYRADPSQYGVDVRKVIAYAWTFSDRGRSYVSTSRAYAGNESTVSVIRSALFFPPRPPHKPTADQMAKYYAYLDRIKEANRCWTEDDELIDAILAAVDSVDAASDYGQNLRVILASESGMVSGRNVGILASLVAVYAREQQLAVERERKAPAAKGFLADVKVRIKRPIRIKLSTVRLTYTDFGPATFMVGRTEDEHTVVWRASKNVDVVTGDTLVLSAATVKAHEEFKGVDQTVLTRCVIESVEKNNEIGDAE